MAWGAIVVVVCLAVAGCYAVNTACDSGPCLSGGSCSPSGASSYSCSCSNGYAGANCQFSACSSWASATSIGFNPNYRGGLDGSLRWTFIQKEGFATAGTLLGFKFNSYRVLPLTIGIYRPTGGTCAFTLIALFTPNIQETGVITYNIPTDQRITVQANDTLGFTWTQLGVVTYNDVGPYQYCEDNQSPPAVGSTITLVDRRYGNRAYSIQAFITPTAPVTPGPSLGFSPVYRGNWDGSLLWTMIQTSGFPLAGSLTGFEFYAQVLGRPIQLGLYRPAAGCTFTLLKSWTPTISAQGLITVKFTGSDITSFNVGDTIGITWTYYGTIPYDVSSDFNYCEDNVGQPAVGSQVSLVGGRYGNRFYSVRPIVQYSVQDACASGPCQNGGYCCNGQSTYYCQCPAGTVQPNCAKATTCAQSPCINGGTCVTVSKTSYTCTCLPGYSGANCQTSPCDKSVTQSIGFTPVWRAGLDGNLQWTAIQTKGFPTAGVLTGYNFYAPYPRPLQVGVYRPKGNCKFQLLQRWSHQINNVGQQSIILDTTEQYNFQAGDTIGFTWTAYGAVSHNDVNGYNYCEDNQGQPAVGGTLALVGGRYGNRVYSFEAVYMQNGPGVGPAYLGFPIVMSRAAEGSLLWTHIQIRGFQTAGALVGFKFYATSVRPLQLGLYRPVKGTCAYQLLKGWTPNINNIGENVVYFTGADQANFQVGDTIGFTWTNYGVVNFDVSSDYNYCEDNVAQPAVGSQVSLVAGRYGNRFWSLQAVYKPTVSSTPCQAPSGCSPNPCLNGATCDADDTGAYSCTCPDGFSGNNCEVPPAAQPCGNNFNGSLSIGYQPYDRINIDGTLLWTFVQAKGFPSAGILTGFQFYATYARPLTVGLYRWVDGCTFTLLKSWAPKITNVPGVQTISLSSSDQYSFLAGDTIGITWTNLGVIPYAPLPANDYLYCENNVAPPGVGGTFSLQIGRYGNRFYSIQAFYSPTSIAPQPLSFGWDTVLRGGLDGSLVWTFVQLNGFQTAGVLVGFQYYVYIVRPITFGIYRPIGGTCSYILLKTYTPAIVNIGVNKYILSPSDQFQFQAGDTLGFTWTALGAITYEDVVGQQYCEDNQAVTTEGSTITLVAKRYGARVYSAQALYRPISSTGYYVDYCASSPCQGGGTCCSTTSSFQCSCPANTLPPNCAPTDPCLNKPCANGGECTKISSTAFSCNCKIGFDGDTCNNVVPDPCGSSPCKNGGSCTRLDNANYVCECSAKYVGATCQTAVQPCDNSPCKNGATCSASSGSYSCICPVGYSGTNCDTVVPNPCTPNPCKNGGGCTRTSNTGFSCQCGSSYAGTNCETALPCASSPCKNGGTCTNVNTPDGPDYECNCPDDYNDGDTCSTFQDPCAVSTGQDPPCKNGGKCNRLNFADYTCTCVGTWVGTTCELNPDILPCDNIPCLHGGTCKNLGGLSYSCKCSQMWEGPTCNIVHCLTETAQCSQVPNFGRYAYCTNCTQFIGCRSKRQKLRTCNLYPSFSRTLRKCTNDTVNACAGL